MIYVIELLLEFILFSSLLVFIFDGMKYSMSDGITPENGERVSRNIRRSIIFFFLSLFALILIWIF